RHVPAPHLASALDRHVILGLWVEDQVRALQGRTVQVAQLDQFTGREEVGVEPSPLGAIAEQLQYFGGVPGADREDHPEPLAGRPGNLPLPPAPALVTPLRVRLLSRLLAFFKSQPPQSPVPRRDDGSERASNRGDYCGQSRTIGDSE